VKTVHGERSTFNRSEWVHVKVEQEDVPNPVSKLHSIVSTHSTLQKANFNVTDPLITHSITNTIYYVHALEKELIQETCRNVWNFPTEFSSRNEGYMEY
jgi:hypothetical protein